jgi:hypothetical protein
VTGLKCGLVSSKYTLILLHYRRTKVCNLSLKHILISLTSFMGTPNSMKILCNTSLLIESQACLKFINNLIFNLLIVGGGVQTGSIGTAAIYCPLVPAPGDCEDGELFGGMKIGRGIRSTRRKPAPAPLCPPKFPLDQTRDRTQAAAVWSQRLTA